MNLSLLVLGKMRFLTFFPRGEASWVRFLTFLLQNWSKSGDFRSLSHERR